MLHVKMKVSIIGAGNVGATLAQLVAEAGVADVMLYDIVEGIPQGKALDMAEACPLWRSSSDVRGTNDIGDTAGSDIVVITAGSARKPGMSRDDLLKINAKVVKSVALRVSKASPECMLIVVTNPMDAMTYLAWEASGFQPERVIGMGGVLDAARLRTFIARELGVSASDVEAMVLGGHGDRMVPLPDYTTVKGIPITELISAEEINSLMERTKNGGAEIVSLLKTGSAYYAPAAAIFEMARAILLDEKRVLPCSVHLNGEYGISGIYAGVPAVLGRSGVEKIIELKLKEAERRLLLDSANAVRDVVDKISGI